jgi:glutamate formiminotransferase / 5-formyltetrahydrofolate cyclo-ligase
MPSSLPLLAVPNVAEGSDSSVIEAIGEAFVAGGRVRLLDVHSDEDHQRTVYTLVGELGELAEALLAGARVAVDLVDISDGRGAHPHVGAIDVVPVVYLAPRARGAACAEALLTGDLIGDRLQLPVFLYGQLGRERTRSDLRSGGPERLRQRLQAGQLKQDFGPGTLHRTAGATLVGARPPLVAFNLELAQGATLEDARRIAAAIREGGEEGLDGVRAIGVALRSGGGGPRAQVSTNVERPERVPLKAVVEAVARHREIASAELVGLAPRAALVGFPAELPIVGFDPGRHLIENALGF